MKKIDDPQLIYIHDGYVVEYNRSGDHCACVSNGGDGCLACDLYHEFDLGKKGK